MIVWIINPYGNLPDEGWRTYRSTMIANALVAEGFVVHQYISNYEHRSKKFRSPDYRRIVAHENYIIHVIPCTSYKSHISLDRILYERSFAKNLKIHSAGQAKPDLVILAEPALFYYDLLLKWIKHELKVKLLLDIIDIWPELFELLFPKRLSFLSKIALLPLYLWRQRLYKQADSLIAVSQNYLKIGLGLKDFEPNLRDVVYWSYPDEPTEPTAFYIESNVIKNLVHKKGKNEVWGVYAGTLGENYDIKSIVDASKIIGKRFNSTEFKLLIAGDGPLATFCNEVNDDQQIFFLGRLPAQQLSALLKNSDFAFSTYKGKSTVAMPIKAFDYLAFGLPLVNSLGRDLGDFVDNNKIGINYLPESVESLSDAMRQLIQDKGKRLQCKVNCLELAEQFSELKQYAKFVAIVKNTLNGT